MSRTSNSPAVLKDSWQIDPRPTAGRRVARFGWRLLFVMLAVGLLLLFGVLLAQPVLHENTYVVLVNGGKAEVPNGSPIYYGDQDFKGFQSLGPSLAVRFADSVNNVFQLDSEKALQEVREYLSGLPAGSRDVLILYFSAHGLVMDNQPYFLCQDYDGAEPDRGRIPFSEFLKVVDACPAGKKLIILETGQYAMDSRLGTVASLFPGLIRKQLLRSGIKNTWVLGACGDLQRSFVSGADKRSSFGYFVTRAFHGQADLDADGILRLNEVFRYVQANVTAYAKQQSVLVSQTPFLCGHPALGSSADPVLLSVEPLLVEPEGSLPMAGGAESAKAGPGAADDAKVVAVPPESTKTGGGDSGPAIAGASSSEKAESVPPKKVDKFASVELASPLKGQGAYSGAKRQELTGLWRRAYGDVSQIQKEAWALFFEFEVLQPFGCRPIDYAPRAWRQLGELIAWYDFRSRQPGDRIEVKGRLEGIVGALKALKGGGPIPVAFRSELIDRILASRPIPTLQDVVIPSMGFWGQLKVNGLVASDQKFEKMVAEFDLSIEQSDSQELVKWLGKYPNWDIYFESRLAKQVLDIPNLVWSQQQGVLLLARFSESIGGPRIDHVPWVKHQLADADRLRTRALRMLRDQTVSGWQESSMAAVAEARGVYHAAKGDLAQVEKAERLRGDILFRLPYYCRIPFPDANVNPDVVYRRLSRLVAAFSVLDVALNDLGATNAFALNASIDEVVEAHKKWMEAVLPSPAGSGDGLSGVERRTVSLEGLLALPVIDVDTRSELLHRLYNRMSLKSSELLPSKIEQFGLLPFSGSDAVGFGVHRHFDAELRVSQFAVLGSASSKLSASELKESLSDLALKLDRLRNPSFESVDIETALRKTNAAFVEFYRDLYSHWESEIRGVRDLSDMLTRAENLKRLRKSWQVALLIDPRSFPRGSQSPVYSDLANADCYDWLDYQSRRFSASNQSQTSDDRQFLNRIVNQYRVAMQKIAMQPVVTPIEMVSIELSGQPQVSLAGVDSTVLEMGCLYRGSSPDQVRVFIDYDTTSVSVKPLGLGQVYDLNQLRISHQELMNVFDQKAVPLVKDRVGVGSPVKKSDPLDMGAGLVSLPATYVASPGEERKFRFELIPLPDGKDSRIVVMAEVNGQIIRKITLAAVASRSAWNLVVQPRQSEISYPDFSRINLHPFPNQTADYDLFLQNKSSQTRKVSMQILAPSKPVDLSLPGGEVSKVELKGVLSSAGGMRVLFQSPEWDMPAASGLIRVPTPVAPKETKGGAPEKPTKEPPEVSVRHGLLAVLTDSVSLKSQIWRFDFMPQKPNRFLEVVADYDAARERVGIRVWSPRAHAIPGDGHEVVCEFKSPLPLSAQSLLRGRVTKDKRQLELFADVATSVDRVETVYMHVDGYPRAFIFQIPCQRSRVDIFPSTNEMNMFIELPVAGKSYKAPVDEIDVSFRVDLPASSFGSPTDSVRLGIDADRDRELAKEPTVEFLSDRQADVWFKGFDLEGRIKTRNQVGDFNIKIPGAGYRNSKVNLLGKIEIGSRVKWSNPVEILLDSEPPNIDRILFESGTIATPKEKLKIRVLVDDGQMSGVKSVEIGFADQAGGLSSELPVT
ncbi:MAG: hypothetical protein P8M80_02220, partial [Pirellulaceae bacterium]|nr:hypothetical protein [Pirellulaceae bacterium]